MKTKTFKLSVVIGLMLFSCTTRKDQTQLQAELTSLNLIRGDIALCGSGEDEFGTVGFGLACSEAVRKDFNLATAMLHSFEYTEAEKVFGKVIEQDPECVMAYWGAAMCSFHPLWAPPGESDLEKGARIVGLGRSMVDDKSSRESDYLEAIATIYDDWKTLDHKTRVLKFEKACQALYEKYPNDTEAAVFYALALDASADPADKTFRNQKKAGTILNAIFSTYPDHPGIAHYIIHNYDYPELAEQGLAAARKYAAIAAASAHAQHMPSHIFTRLGLWDESIQSNIKSVEAARCYADNLGIKGHWAQELHGLDYLMYAYLQKGNDVDALKQLDYVTKLNDVFPMDFAGAYSFGAIPARYAVERKDWKAAANLEHDPAEFPWDKFPWESANVNFARLLGAVHVGDLELAKKDLQQLEALHKGLQKTNEYQSNLVMIQIKASQAWIMFAEGKKS